MLRHEIVGALTALTLFVGCGDSGGGAGGAGGSATAAGDPGASAAGIANDDNAGGGGGGAGRLRLRAATIVKSGVLSPAAGLTEAALP